MFFVVCVFLFVATLCCYNNTIVELCSKIFVNASSSLSNTETELLDLDNSLFFNDLILGSSQIGEGSNPLSITGILANNKTYDGSTNIEIEIQISGVIGTEDVYVVANANTLDKNAGEKKYVEITDFELCGEDANNYYLTTDHEIVLVDIYKKNVDLIWHTSGNPMNYIFDGTNQIGTIYPYFLEENSSSGSNIHKLSYNISGYSLYNGSIFNNEFVNAGEYTAKVVLTQEESMNYNILFNGETKDEYILKLKMNRKMPNFVVVEDLSFTYTGLEQDASCAVYVDNDEQIPIYSGNKFTTVNEGKSLQMRVTVHESLNYLGRVETYTNFDNITINIEKALGSINIENVKRQYKYNGQVQRVNSGATINNIEQRDLLTYDDNGGFVSVAEGNALNVLVYARETENYKYASIIFGINVNKKAIDTSGWQWSINSLVYNGKSQEIKIKNINEALITPFYIDNIKTEAGIYCAKVSLKVLDEGNYLPVTYPDKIWTIEKKLVEKPNVTNKTTEYNGSYQDFNISQNQNNDYVVLNNHQKNAGSYTVVVSLSDSKNCSWADGTVGDICTNWTISKKKIETPRYISTLLYNGKQQTISVLESDLYYLINNNQKNVGEYSSYLVLSDVQNYEWANSNDATLKLDWKIVFDERYNTSTPTIAILFSILLIVLLALPVTLHFTNVIKRRRKKSVVSNTTSEVASQNIQVDKNENVVTVEANFSKNIQNFKSKDNKANKVDDKPSINSIKTRKTRMVSMKKVDKKNRRIKELKIKKRVPAKRGRPPKKKTKRAK